MEANETSNPFDLAAATWDEKPSRVELAHRHVNAIKSKVLLNDTMDLLDYGCGTGLVSLQLLPHVKSLLGLDTSAGMLEVFRRRLTENRLTNGRCEIMGSTIPENSFHLIISTMTMHHVENLAPLFKQFHTALHSGGRVALLDLDEEDGSFHGVDAAGVFHLGFNRNDFASALKDAGFRNISVDTASTFRREGDVRDYSIFIALGEK